MNAIDEMMDKKLGRQVESRQVESQKVESLQIQIIQKNLQIKQLRDDRQELLDALGPYARASWIHPSVHANAVAVHNKFFESMMTCGN